MAKRWALFLIAVALFAQQAGQGPFRPANNIPGGLPPTVPQKGAAWYPGRIAFINSVGLLDGLTGTASDCVHIDGSSAVCGSGGNSPVATVFGRIGTVTAQNGDYAFSQISGTVDLSQLAQAGAVSGNPLCWNGTQYAPNGGGCSVSGGGGGAVSSVFGRTTAVIAQTGDYAFSQISGSLGLGQLAQSGATANQVLAWNGTQYAPTSLVSPSFSDAETPGGTINGSNTVFTLAHSPNPALSLVLTRNGVVERQSADYSLSGASVTFITAATPQAGDLVQAWYRY